MRRLARRTAISPSQSGRFKATLSALQAGASAPVILLNQGIPTHPAGEPDLNLLRHELRTPLTGMLGLAEMLSVLDLPGKAILWLATLQACGQQMASLIDRALRSEDSGTVLQPQRVDGLQLMESLVAAHWPAARAGRTSLILAFHPEALGLWQTDTVALRQAVDNLLANAIRFSRNGYVLLEVRAVAPQRAGVDLLELVIEDSGPDPKCTASNLQDESEFADRTYHMYSRGRGLQVVEQACQRFAGNLQRSASNSGGARFILTLNDMVPELQKQIQPFRPALLNKLHCLLKLEISRQRAVAAMLGCLDISFEAINPEVSPELNRLPPSQVLVCAQALLPLSLQRCNGNSTAHSIWLLASVPGTTGPELYQQLLPEPLFQADLQNALLRCLVVQGTPASQQRPFSTMEQQ
jgi:anti-sigma regulatory factor (Ser/Thr protein kinase)